MRVLLPLLTVAGLHLISCMSPGPNFLVSVRAGLHHPARILLATTLGVCTGTLTWTLLGVLGFTAVILGSPGLFLALKILGGAYLARLGFLALRSAWKGSGDALAAMPLAASAPGSPGVPDADAAPPVWKAYRAGLLTCLSNPKAAAYYLALFTTVLGPRTPAEVRWLLVPLLPSISFSFYTLAALAAARFRKAYSRAVRWVDFLFGVVMIAVGLRIFFAVA